MTQATSIFGFPTCNCCADLEVSCSTGEQTIIGLGFNVCVNSAEMDKLAWKENLLPSSWNMDPGFREEDDTDLFGKFWKAQVINPLIACED